MRTVTGPTDRVVIVGAGLGGLACALHLAATGREVTVLERESVPGGRAGRLSIGGYEFDTGPTVLTMPDLLAEALAAVGEEHGRLARPDPARPGLPGALPRRLDPRRHRRHRPDGRRDLPGLRPARGRRLPALRRLRRAAVAPAAGRLHRPQHGPPRDLLTGNLLRLLGTGGFRRLDTKIAQFFADPAHPAGLLASSPCTPGSRRTRRSRSTRSSPTSTRSPGVYFPRGGIHAVPLALAGAAEKHGVTLPVRHDGHRRRGARPAGPPRCTTADRRADPGRRRRAQPGPAGGLPRPAAEDARAGCSRLRHSPSAVVLHVGSNQRYSKIAHHNIHFGSAWRGTFDEVIRPRRADDATRRCWSRTRRGPTRRWPRPAGRSTTCSHPRRTCAVGDLRWRDGLARATRANSSRPWRPAATTTSAPASTSRTS